MLRDEHGAGELTLTFVDDEEIAELNVEHLGHEGSDRRAVVPARHRRRSPGLCRVLLGDVVVCPAVAADQSGEHAGTLDDELALLVVHGVLHVLGHDHARTPSGRGDAAARAGAARAPPLARARPVGFRQEHDDQ